MPSSTRPHRKLSNRMAGWMRWLHIYSSLLGLAMVLFFSVTGFTLNHAEWFYGGQASVRTSSGMLDKKWLGSSNRGSISDQTNVESTSTAPRANDPTAGGSNDGQPPVGPSKLEIVEYMRKQHGIKVAMKEFVSDEFDMTVTFVGPGYSADVSIDPKTGSYELIETFHGFVAVLNDLHKGRDTGLVWSWVIDISAALLTFISLTGLTLLIWIRRRYLSGVVSIIVGTAVLLLIYWLAAGR